MTPKEAAGLISFAQLAGMDPTEGMAQNLKGAATVYAAALDQWGISVAEAEAAVLAIAGEPWTSEYRRKVPTPGEIVARTPVGRRALELGTDEDCDRAWSVFRSRMMGLLPDGPATWQDIANGEAAGRAFLAGLAAMGGTEGFRMARPEDPWPVKAWKEGYRAERKRQAAEPREVRKMLPTNEPKMLESGK